MEAVEASIVGTHADSVVGEEAVDIAVVGMLLGWWWVGRFGRARRRSLLG